MKNLEVRVLAYFRVLTSWTAENETKILAFQGKTLVSVKIQTAYKTVEQVNNFECHVGLRHSNDLAVKFAKRQYLYDTLKRILLEGAILYTFLKPCGHAVLRL
jgi:hypothetical protein